MTKQMTSLWRGIRVHPHLATATQTFYAVTVHTWRHNKMTKTHRCRKVQTDPNDVEFVWRNDHYHQEDHLTSRIFYFFGLPKFQRKWELNPWRDFCKWWYRSETLESCSPLFYFSLPHLHLLLYWDNKKLNFFFKAKSLSSSKCYSSSKVKSSQVQIMMYL